MHVWAWGDGHCKRSEPFFAEADIVKGKAVLDRLDARYPNSATVRFYKGRHYMVTKRISEAIGMRTGILGAFCHMNDH